MDDRFNLLILKDRIQCIPVQDICFVKLYFFPCYLFYALDCLLAGIIQIIDYNDIVSGI